MRVAHQSSGLLFGCLLLLGGCTARTTPSFALLVRVDSDPEVGLPGARLSTLGRPLGQTNEQGLYLATLRGAVGETVELKVTCPEGYRSPAVPLSVRLRAPSIREQRPEYRVLCPSLIRRLLLAIRTDGVADMAVKVLGAEVARTDAQGAAHALLAVAPGDTVLVELDSSSQRHAGLMPRNPALRIVMPEHDEVVLFDQTFTRPAPPRKKRPPKEPVGPQPI